MQVLIAKGFRVDMRIAKLVKLRGRVLPPSRDMDNPPWIESMLGPPVLRAGRVHRPGKVREIKPVKPQGQRKVIG